MADFGQMVSGKGEGAGGARFDKAAYKDTLISVVHPKLSENVDTKHGATDAIFAKYIVVHEGEDEGLIFDGPALFGAQLVPELDSAEGPIVAGRISVGEAKAGRSAPWIWEDPSDDERAKVIGWFNDHAEIKDDEIVLAAG